MTVWNIEVKRHQGHYSSRIYINGVWVGIGTYDECQASAAELRGDDDKAKAVYDIFKEKQ